ncbi:MAG TPA: outer membrane protein assembly factor BamC [Gammaproteobacteria bacterium]|nr:outer membrane protein assembly factor BamC [Gammaproteobacteria bacterium]
MSSVVHSPIFVKVSRWGALPLLLSLTACSWFSGEDDATASAPELPPLEVPPDLVSPQGDPRLARPVLPKPAATKPAELGVKDCRCSEPPRIGEQVLPPNKGVQRLREGQRRWLRVEAEPEQVWPLVRKFLEQRGYRVMRDEPAIGLLETDWKPVFVEENLAKGESNWRESLRIRIEPADQAGRTEIFLAQRNSQRVKDEAGEHWELRPADAGRAVEMLNRLARYLAGENVSDAVPLEPLAARIDVDDADHSVIVVDADFDRVWRRTSLALQDLGFTLEDSDRANRIFHIYNELPSGLSEEELKHGKKRSATVREDFWIHLREVGKTTHISVRDKEGVVDESQVARHLLTQLLGQLG